MLAGILGLTLVAGKALEYRQLSSQVAQLDSQIEAVFKEALPESRMVRPLTQMENHIKFISVCTRILFGIFCGYFACLANSHHIIF